MNERQPQKTNKKKTSGFSSINVHPEILAVYKRLPPLKINMSPKKGTISKEIIWTNHWYWGDMPHVLAFGGVGL